METADIDFLSIVNHLKFPLNFEGRGWRSIFRETRIKNLTKIDREVQY